MWSNSSRLLTLPGSSGTPPAKLDLSAYCSAGWAREIQRMCQFHHHSLPDFRVEHHQALKGLFEQVLGMLLLEKMIRADARQRCCAVLQRAAMTAGGDCTNHENVKAMAEREIDSCGW